jgi:hypothetical protein
VIRPEQPFEPAALARAGKREPVVPGHVFLPFDHQADAHHGIMPVEGR